MSSPPTSPGPLAPLVTDGPLLSPTSAALGPPTTFDDTNVHQHPLSLFTYTGRHVW
jgi:hypothetical protein